MAQTCTDRFRFNRVVNAYNFQNFHFNLRVASQHYTARGRFETKSSKYAFDRSHGIQVFKLQVICTM